MDKKQIMIVEDERIIAEDIKRTLINFGYAVTGILSSGELAIKAARDKKPDLVLMDIMLEGPMNGIEAAGIIRSEIQTPVIYLTAYANEKTLQSAKITEPFGYIIKPFEERELHATIEMAFYRHKIEKAIQRKTSQQEQLLESARHLTSSLDVKEVLTQIGKGATDILRSSSCAIYLMKDNQTLNPVVAIDPEFDQEILKTDLSIDNSFTGRAVKEGRALIFNEVRGNPVGMQIPGTSVIEDERVISAPFLVDNQVLGAMCLSRIGEDYTEEDLTLAEAYATYASTALKNAQTHNQLRKEMEERKLTQKKLVETQFRLTSIFKNVPNIILYEKFGGRDFISDNIEQLIGITADKIIADKIDMKSLMHPDDQAQYRNSFTKWYKSGDTNMLSLLYRLKKADGNYLWIEDRMAPIVNEKGEKYISGVMIDNTTLKEAEEALRESQLQYKAVVEDQSELIIRYLAEGTITFINDAFCRYYKCNHKSYQGTNWFTHFTPEKKSSILDKIKTLDSVTPNLVYEDEIIQGKKVNWLEWTHRAIFNEDNQIIEYQAVGRDITDRKLAEAEKEKLLQQLIQSQKMEVVGRLAGGIAHDFNNLLTAINGYADLVLKKISASDPIRKDIEVILNCGERASDLTRQLLAFSRKQIVEPKLLNLNSIILDMDKMLRRLIGEDLELITYPGENLLTVKVDKSQIEQVVTNLVVNARDAMQQGGKIIVRTENKTVDQEINSVDKVIIPGDYVVLTVKDTGIGMSDEIKQHLFEPFFTTKDQGKGTGLGLATVFGIIEQNKGFIIVESSPNIGSEFIIYFPAFQEEPQIIERPVKDDELPRGFETILLTEDEPSIREFVIDILEEFGYKVIGATNGIDALNKAKNLDKKIHLLVTDVVMPNMNGHQLADKIRSLHPDTKVLFISGYTESVAVQKGITELNAGFLQKPFSSSDLVNKVRYILDN
ncbi:MAG: response regulator [Candidatus Cloacimonetes bacterium]|nr:response regulator [Candidatus Cloacimonadota bacterium]